MAAIRHQINVAVPVRTVWKALTTEQGLVSWWANRARVDARAGGRLVLHHTGPEGTPELEERGIFHELRPTRKIEIAWDANSPSPAKGSRITFQLARDGDETRLSLVQSGGGALEDEEARGLLDEAWRQRLLQLRSALEGES